jgi:hypothetical protein
MARINAMCIKTLVAVFETIKNEPATKQQEK